MTECNCTFVTHGIGQKLCKDPEHSGWTIQMALKMANGQGWVRIPHPCQLDGCSPSPVFKMRKSGGEDSEEGGFLFKNGQQYARLQRKGLRMIIQNTLPEQGSGEPSEGRRQMPGNLHAVTDPCLLSWGLQLLALVLLAFRWVSVPETCCGGGIFSCRRDMHPRLGTRESPV